MENVNIEKPILFSTEMVRAILEGRKTQTRRIIKWPKTPDWHDWDYEPNRLEGKTRKDFWPHFRHVSADKDKYGAVKCPYGSVEDQLWIREKWNYFNNVGDCGIGCEYGCKHGKYVYAATGDWDNDTKWKPSIHMPKNACRLRLAVTDIRVERLDEISAEDAIAEGFAKVTKDGGRTWKYGIPEKDGYPGPAGWVWQEWEVDPVKAYKKLWESINGEESWNGNPWVWVVEFSKVEVSNPLKTE